MNEASLQLFARTSVLAVAALLLPSNANADDRAIAQQTFQEGRTLLAAGKIAEACPKFAAAAELSQTPGVRLNLADCYARLGKTASAWAKANEALSMAERVGDSAAISVAHNQMSALHPKLSYLTFVVATETAPRSLEVVLDGEKIPPAVWGTALPVDPGEHAVMARAPGRLPFSTHTTIAGAGVRATVSVPVLSVAPEAPAAQLPASTRGANPDPTEPGGSSEGGWSRSTARTLALVSGGLGIVGLGVGAGFGLDAGAKKSDYEQHQTGGRCNDEQCVTLSQSAVSAARASTIAFVAGGALVAAGVVLWLTAPGRNAKAGGVMLVPMVDARTTGAGVLGRW